MNDNYMNDIVVIELFWDSGKNGGSIIDIKPSIDGEMYWWKCYNCGKSYKSTLNQIMYRFFRNNTPQLNIVCSDCGSTISKFSYGDIEKFVDDDILNSIRSYTNESNTRLFYFPCFNCGDYNFISYEGLRKRKILFCKSCFYIKNALEKYGSLADVRPDILPYYSSKNRFSADKVPAHRVNNVDNKIILICPGCGKEIIKRTDAIVRNGAYCGPCANHKNRLVDGETLYDLYPDVAKMLDEADNSVTSKEVISGSWREYKFKCSNTNLPPHTFIKSAASMVAAYKRGNIGCPVCTGREIQEGINDFKSRVPRIAELWDYDKNKLRPEQVYYRSGDKYFFKCEYGHEFEKTLSKAYRNSNSRVKGCPVCAGRVVIRGENDLASVRPDLLDRWDFEINTISPYEVTVESNKMAWFHCENKDCNEVYATTIGNWTSGRVKFCEKCRNRMYSGTEKEIVNMVKSWGIEVLEEYRLLGDNRTFDIYIPVGV